MKKFKIQFSKYTGLQFAVFARYGERLLFLWFFRKPNVWLHDTKLKLISAARHFQLWPVYFVVFRRDCDCHESTTLRKYPFYSLALRSLLAEAEDWTEGPFNFWQISRKEAKAFKNSSRDRILEAFEDGRGSHTIISFALLVVASLLIGCSEAEQDKHWPRGQFQLMNGSVVSCRWIDDEPCGLKLHDCTDGKVYQCQTGVVEL